MMRRFGTALTLLTLLTASAYAAGPVPPFVTGYMRTVLDDPNAPAARTTLQIALEEFAPLLFAERTSDPAKPTEGHAAIWMSDGTGLGDDGDLIIAATAGGVTKYGILWDFSAATDWVSVAENVVFAGENVVFAAEQVVYTP